jgi:hypothetical protein
VLLLRSFLTLTLTVLHCGSGEFENESFLTTWRYGGTVDLPEVHFNFELPFTNARGNVQSAREVVIEYRLEEGR